ASYYPWTTDARSNGVAPARDATLVRLVTSFATTADEVDRFVAVARAFFCHAAAPATPPSPPSLPGHTDKMRGLVHRGAFRAWELFLARTQVIRSGDRVLKQRVLLCGSILAFALVGAPAGLAQPVPPPYPGTVYPGEGMILPPYEVAAIVRSTG